MSGGHKRAFTTFESLISTSESPAPTQVSDEDYCLFPQDLPGIRPLNSIFPLLHVALATGPVCLEIPETLFITETGRNSLLFNDDKRSLRLYESSEVLDQFFAQCSNRQTLSDSTLPQYIYHSKATGYKVLFDQVEASRLWGSSREPSRTLQRYIVPKAAEPTKIRIVWRKDQGFRRFRIQKKSLAVFKGRKMPRSNSYNSLTSPYKYDLCTFRHAGQLKKSSFSPTLPFKSVLYDELRQLANKTGRSSPAVVQTHANDSFLVSSRLEGDYRIEELTEALPKAERMAQTLRDTIGKVALGEEEVMEMLAYDVIQGEAGEFYLVNTKWMQVGKAPVSAEIRSASPAEKPQVESLEGQRSLRERFTRVILSPRSGPQLSKVPFIDLKDIQARHALSYRPLHPSNPPASSSFPLMDPMLLQLRTTLSEAESQLDCMQEQAAMHRYRNREVQKVKLEQYSEKMLEQVLSRVYERVRTDTLMMEYFSGKNTGEIAMIKHSFYKAFTGVDNYYFKRNVKKRHEGMGISTKIFRQFMRIFGEVMREEGIKSDDILIVQEHLQRFAEDVVEDEDAPESEERLD